MLCYKCQGGMYIANIGHCGGCGSSTSSGMFKLCPSCAQSKNQCAHCGGPLNAQPPGSNTGSGSQKSSFIVMVNVEHYVGDIESLDREARSRRTAEAMDSFMEQVKAVMAAKNIPFDSLEELNRLTFIGAMLVNCTADVAELLKNHPGVASLSVNGTVRTC